MIQANELRIGNWVENKSEYIRVRDFDNVGVNSTTKRDGYLDTLDRISPIPLTPEILEKAGFKHGVSEGITRFGDTYEEVEEGDTHFWDIPIKRTDLIDHHNISLVKWGEQEYFTFQLERGFYRQRIKYLHQLQNLYFALTGEELNIQL